jgi:transcriptional regulator with XRE-family HTH domain
MDRAEIGRRIRETRRDRGLTQSALARLLGFTSSWVSQVERGGIGLEVPDLDRVARALGTSIAQFIETNTPSSALGELLKPIEDDLTERDKEELLQIARLKAELNRKAEQHGDRGER